VAALLAAPHLFGNDLCRSRSANATIVLLAAEIASRLKHEMADGIRSRLAAA
jgi:hypothetical protein